MAWFDSVRCGFSGEVEGDKVSLKSVSLGEDGEVTLVSWLFEERALDLELSREVLPLLASLIGEHWGWYTSLTGEHRGWYGSLGVETNWSGHSMVEDSVIGAGCDAGASWYGTRGAVTN